MDAFSQLLNGFAVALTPINLLWCLVGTTLGTAIGVLPGLGPALTIALLLPITFKVEPTAAFILFAGIYYGAMYGGSTTSILLNTPGESATIVTALEGNKMARNGRAGAALATAAIGSFVAGTIGTLGITLPRAHRGGVGAQVRAGRLFLPDGARVRDGVGGSRLLRGQRAGGAVLRHLARIDRGRPADRAGAFHLRPSGTARRHQCHRGGGRPVRGRRDALRRLALPARQGRDHPALRLALDDG